MPYGDAMNEVATANEGVQEPTAAAIEHIATVMNNGWLCMLLAVGERLGLHVALAEAGETTASEIAERAGCDTRYLEEWLWGMVASGLVTASDASEPTFTLRTEYVPALTPSGGPLHWSRITTQITALASLEDPLVDAFRTGDGLAADHYEGRVAEVLAGESGPIFERALLTEVLPLTGRVEQLEAGIRVADLGCGTGSALLILAKRFPNSTFIGVDQSRSALGTAEARRDAQGLTNVTFEWGELEGEFEIGEQDLVIAANTVHDLSSPQRFFERVRSILSPGGLLYLHELSATTDMRVNAKDPHALGILAFSLYHCLPLAKRRHGIAPGGMWGRERYVAALSDAGFEDITTHRAPSDPNNDTILARVPQRAGH